MVFDFTKKVKFENNIVLADLGLFLSTLGLFLRVGVFIMLQAAEHHMVKRQVLRN